MGNSNQTFTALDPLTLDPRAISLLIGVARFPEGATINKLSGLLAMSYRSIRSLCLTLAAQKPPLLLVEHGIYDSYTLNPNANLRGLVIQTGSAEQRPTEQLTPATNGKTINQKRKHNTNKRSNLKIESLHAKKLELKDLNQLDFLKKLIGSESLPDSKTALKELSLKDQSILQDFKNIRIGKIEIDQISLATPNVQARPNDQMDRSAEQPRAADRPARAETGQPARLAERTTSNYEARTRPSFSANTTQAADRRIEVEQPDGLFDAFQLISRRNISVGEINPRHNLQYLIHLDKIFEHNVLWHPKFAEVEEKIVIAWIAQAYDGLKSGKITQPWGIVYLGMLGELPFRLPDKRFREGAKNMLPRDFLVACGYHLHEEDLPPTPEEDPNWRAEEGELF